MEIFFISCFFIIFTVICATFSRFLVHIYLENSLLRNFILETIASAELCASSYEVSVVTETNGLFAGCIITFVLLIIWSLTWSKETACPYRSFEDVVDGYIYIEDGLTLILAQIFGSILIIPYVQAFWNLELVEPHIGRETGICMTDLEVSVHKGFIMEALGTFIGRISAKAANRMDSFTSVVINSLCKIALVIAGTNFTGGYYNPVLASVMRLGCCGTSIKDHLIVYWLGPFVGSFLSKVIFVLFTKHSSTPKKTIHKQFFSTTIQYGECY